ncbi:MAG: ribokinase [Leptolyngbya sp. SIO4C1]|nr:ribokinase [Leptolyngbya sp. SIO4C1]
MSILVLGSLNMDLVGRVERLPQPGETLLGETFEMVPGGKGANQAVAAARLGSPVQMIGRVGSDAFGQTLLDSLQRDRVVIEGVTLDSETASGVALIAIAATGENQIIVLPGANRCVGEPELQRLSGQLPQAQVLLLQFEVPQPVVEQAAALAHQAGVQVIVDPAPARQPASPNFFQQIDILTPNQVEATQLCGFEVCDRRSAAKAAKHLRQLGAATVIVKLGHQGAVVESADARFEQPAFPVAAVDTVAAGDAFNGGLAAALVEGQTLPQAVRFASAVAALCVSQPGAQSAMPDRAALDAFLTAPTR